MESLHPLWPLAGGVLIGLSAGIYWLANGRIAGISDLAAKASGLSEDGFRRFAVVFVLGLIGGAWLAGRVIRTPEITITSNPWVIIAAGLLVGFGARLGSGCTSGHGICGIGRLSTRSIVATLLFMAVAMVVTFVGRHVAPGIFA